MYPPARWSRLSSGFICSVCDCSLVVTHSVVTPSSVERLQYLLVLLYFTYILIHNIKHNKEHTSLHYHYTIYNNVYNADGKYDKDAPLMDVLKFVQ